MLRPSEHCWRREVNHVNDEQTIAWHTAAASLSLSPLEAPPTRPSGELAHGSVAARQCRQRYLERYSARGSVSVCTACTPHQLQCAYTVLRITTPPPPPRPRRVGEGSCASRHGRFRGSQHAVYV